MQFEKNHILDLLRAHGNPAKVKAADERLPHSIDTDRHGELLRDLGVGPKDLRAVRAHF